LNEAPKLWAPIPMSNRRFHDYGPVAVSMGDCEIYEAHAETMYMPQEERRVTIKTEGGGIRPLDLILCDEQLPKGVGTVLLAEKLVLLQIQNVESVEAWTKNEEIGYDEIGEFEQVKLTCSATDFWKQLDDEERRWWTPVLQTLMTTICMQQQKGDYTFYRGVPGQQENIGWDAQTEKPVWLWAPLKGYQIEPLLEMWPKVFCVGIGNTFNNGQWFASNFNARQWVVENHQTLEKGIPMDVITGRPVTPARTRMRICNKCGKAISVGVGEVFPSCPHCNPST